MINSNLCNMGHSSTPGILVWLSTAIFLLFPGIPVTTPVRIQRYNQVTAQGFVNHRKRIHALRKCVSFCKRCKHTWRLGTSTFMTTPRMLSDTLVKPTFACLHAGIQFAAYRNQALQLICVHISAALLCVSSTTLTQIFCGKWKTTTTPKGRKDRRARGAGQPWRIFGSELS